MDQLAQFRSEAYRELTESILPFSIRVVTDREHGGFYGLVANDGTVEREAPKALVQHTRMLWTFARADLVVGDPEYRLIASHARKALLDWFWDGEHGGFFWMLDYQGRPLQRDKFTYGQAFAIYGLAEDYLASGNSRSLERAIELYRLLERHGRDPEYEGYWEARRRDWTPAPCLRLDDTDLPVVKGMNTHLHLIEAYANLLRAWNDNDLRASLRALIQTMLQRILNPDTHQFCLFLDREWRPLSKHVSYGHDIEGSWLLVEATQVLGEADLLAQVREAALRMAYTTLEEGVDRDGGLFYAADASGVTERTKVWWPQAEAIVGFLNAYQLSGDRCFLDAALASWRFVQQHLVDRQHGDWFYSVDEAGHPHEREKAGPWKAAYHNARACMEVMERTRKLAGGAQ